MEWKRLTGSYKNVCDDIVLMFKGHEIIIITKPCNNNTWYVTFPPLESTGVKIVADTVEEVKWRAVLALSDECNRRIGFYKLLSDSLPSLVELYDAIQISRNKKTEEA